MQRVENGCRIRDTADMEYSLEQMARSLVESGDYRVISRLELQAEYHPPDNTPKLAAAVVDAETTGTDPDRDRIIELGISHFEYDRQTGAPGSGSKIPDFRSRPRSRRSPALPIKWLPVTASTTEPSTIC
jgi:DNA polymerase III epsilon subunit-like protein